MEGVARGAVIRPLVHQTVNSEGRLVSTDKKHCYNNRPCGSDLYTSRGKLGHPQKKKAARKNKAAMMGTPLDTAVLVYPKNKLKFDNYSSTSTALTAVQYHT